MRIKRVQYKQAEEFLKDNFSSPTHWPDWNYLVEKYYNTNFYYLGAFNTKKRLVGICPIHEVKQSKILCKSYSGQFHFIPNGGWIFSKKLELNPSLFPAKWNNHMEVFGLSAVPEFNIGIKNIGRTKKTLVVDLDDAVDEIWEKNINSKKRNKIRKARKEGVVIKKATSEEQLEDFYRLYIEASARFTKNPLKLNFFKELFFETNNIAFDIFMAKIDGRQIANVGIISDKNYSLYWLGNNAVDVMNFGQGDLLQWYAIQQMKEKGCKYYDLCYIDPEKLPHIYEFKKGFSNTEVPIYFFSKKSLFFTILNKFLA